ncbi:CDP-alcohol phosphatidyltransferase family protein [Antarcticirhabdus aurantiaca]|uniref:CDP-alcohol phosphatidyltransferase family protein n=1 Tax=Antarcticirhabdus aurantiaca TaxID=2606717 RepID=A0ACD4NXF6_9HYPH|nr:CDP-alcohol phosphatidyltransferase family protein [Antarcticirhabdus aurantiaca]WAJ31536.1 CDP-alcohol phosphatidyltransferase family protein [Jeongeuplla avenae]
MLDGLIRPHLDPWLRRAALRLKAAGATPNGVTVAGFLLGAAAFAAIALGLPLLGGLLVLVSRLADGLDGALAAETRRTDLGGYLDIVLDFAFYGLIPLGFAIQDPAVNALPAAVLLCAFYANGASFLAFSALAAKRGLESRARGEKSIYFTTGLAEATETIAVFLAFCLFPAAFPALAYGFAAVTLWTTAFRLREAARLFG